MEPTDTGTSYGRSMNVTAFGDSVDELELGAFDEARELFGADARLEVVRTYSVHTISGFSPRELRESGKKYFSRIEMREVIAR